MRQEPAITFVFPNYRSGSLDYHLGVNYIIAYLKTKRIYTQQLVSKERLGLKQLVELILKQKSKIIGFTCFNTNYRLIKLLSQAIKARRPDILIITGGPMPTFSDEELLKDTPEIDICVRYEGEYTTHQLIKHIKNKQEFNDIKGITYRQANKIIRNPDRPLITHKQNKKAELDMLPSPFLTGVLKPKDLLSQNGRITIMTSRGCVYKCAYCNFSAMSKHTIRYYSLDRVMAELRMISRLKDKRFNVLFNDETFTFNKKRVRDLCQRIIKEKISLNIWVSTRADRMDDQLIKLLFAAGVRRMDFGLESAVPKIVYAMKKARKSYSPQQGLLPEKRHIQSIKDGVIAAKRLGIEVSVGTIFGFPGERLKDGLKTLDFVKSLGVDEYSHNFLQIFPGTELFNAVIAKKKTNSSRSIQKKQLDVLSIYRYAEYPLERLPVLDNAYSHTRRKQRISFFVSHILTGAKIPIESIYPECVIFTGKNLPLQWFKDNLSLQTRIIFGDKLSNLLNHKHGNLKISAKEFAEIISLNLHTPKELEKEDVEIGSKNCSFTKLDQINIIKDEKSNGSIKILDINNQRGLLKLKTYKNHLSDCVILDGCRWSSYCPATKLQRLIVDQKGNIRTCFHGKIIGKTTTSLNKLKKRVRILMKQAAAQRGCNKCPINAICSKCLFLDSISSKEYCKTMRAKPHIAKLVNSFNILNSARFTLKALRNGELVK